MFDHLLGAIIQSFNPWVILGIIGGTLIGAAIGCLPGLTATMGIALLLPLTFGMPPVIGLACLLAVYGAGIYGGSISAILINIPGTPASAATTLDGYPMTLKGEAGHALGIAATVSSLGGLISVFFLAVAAPQISSLTLQFGPPEIFVVSLFGLSTAALVSGKSTVKGLVSVCLGLLLSFTGIDPIVGCPRFTFGNDELLSGIPFIPALIGLFAIPEVITSISTISLVPKLNQKISKVYMTLKEIKDNAWNISRSAMIGIFIGALPGAGGDIAAWVAYGAAKKASKNAGLFGQGAQEGVVASETANNASTGGAMTTMLTLGIPGDAPTAVIIGALMMYGLRPGPMLFSEQTQLVYSIFIIMAVANVCLLFLRFGLIKYLAKVITVPRFIFLPIILVLCVMGAYALNNSTFDAKIMFFFGLVWFLLYLCEFPAAPAVLGLILGPIMESNFRRALIMSDNPLEIFFSRPLSAIPLFILIVVLGWPVIAKLIRFWKSRKMAH